MKTGDKTLDFRKFVFFIVCLLVGVTPLFRGSVHQWAQSLIQVLVLTGLLFIRLDRIRAREGVASTSNSSKRNTGIGQDQKDSIMPTKTLFRFVILPCMVLGTWATVGSRHHLLAMEGLIMLFTYLALFYLTVESVRTRQQQRILVGVIVATALLLSIIGILKRFDVMIFPWWDYTPELGKKHGALSVSGVYGNRNHMAGFLEMAIPMLSGMFLTRSRPVEQRLAMIALLLFLVFTQILTLSRGGWAATTGALAFMTVVLLFKKNFYHKPLLVSIVVGALVVVGIILTSTSVVDRLITLTQQDATDNLTGRLIYWDSTWNLIKDNLLTGTGPGTFTRVFPAYVGPGLSTLPMFAHNDYLQFAAETGVLFFPLMLWLLFLFFRMGFKKIKSRSRQTMGISLGGMAAVVAILIHSFSDFNLHVPANVVLFSVILGVIVGGWREPQSKDRSM